MGRFLPLPDYFTFGLWKKDHLRDEERTRGLTDNTHNSHTLRERFKLSIPNKTKNKNNNKN